MVLVVVVVVVAGLLPLTSAKSVIYGVGDGTVLGTAEEPCLNYDAAADDYELWDLPQPANPSTYEPPASLNYTTFVVLSAPRSASTSLVDALNANWGLQMLKEMFRGNQVPQILGRDSNWTLEKREANRTEFMRTIFELNQYPAKVDALARGFKVFQTHLTEDELRRITRPKHVLKIVLRRQDLLSQYVSNLRAQDLGGSWQRPDSGSEAAEAYATERVPVCVEAYEKFVKNQNAWYEWCAEEARQHPESWLFISTEELISSPYAMAQVYAHLKVPLGEMFDYRPYASDLLEEKVYNFDDIKDLPRDVNNKW